MKTATVRRNIPICRAGLPFPNAATRRQVLDRVVDLALTFSLGGGAAAIVLFILAVG